MKRRKAKRDYLPVLLKEAKRRTAAARKSRKSDNPRAEADDANRAESTERLRRAMERAHLRQEQAVRDALKAKGLSQVKGAVKGRVDAAAQERARLRPEAERLRRERHLSQQAIANTLKVSRKVVRRILSGE